MKKILLAVMGIIILTAAQATIRVVNNNNPSPGQYSDLQVAINAASAGDTIYVTGSPNLYPGIISIAKRLVIIGTGHKPQKTNPLVSRCNQLSFTDKLASGSQIIGLEMDYLSFIADSVADVIVKRNKFNVGLWSQQSGDINSALNGTSAAYRWLRLTIEGNYFAYGGVNINMGYYPPMQNVYIRNNVFAGSMFGFVSSFAPMLNVFLTNNLFIGNGVLANNGYFQGAYVYSNIFIRNGANYGTLDPTSGANVASCEWRYNLSYGFSTSSFPNTGSVGTGSYGNLNLVAPQFTNFTTSAAGPTYWDYIYNFTPGGGSPLINGGNDGTDIGPTGNSTVVYNKYGIPNIPQIRAFTITSPVTATVAPGGTVTVNIISTIKN